MKLSEFRDRMRTLDLRERHNKYSGLGGMYKLIDDLSSFERLMMRFKIWWYLEGDEKIGLLKTFEMYNEMKKAMK